MPCNAEFRRKKCNDAFIYRLNNNGYHILQHFDICTTSSDNCTSYFSIKFDYSFNTARNSLNFGISSKCICDCCCQWSTATSVLLNSNRDHAIEAAFCGAPHCRICIIFIQISTLSVTLKFYNNFRNHRFNTIQTDLSVNRTLQHKKMLKLFNILITVINSFVSL